MFLLIIRNCGSLGISGVWGDRIGLIFSYAEFMENKWSPKLESPYTANAEQLPLPAVESHSVLQLGKAAGFSRRGRTGGFCSYYQCDVRMMALLVVASVKRSSLLHLHPQCTVDLLKLGSKALGCDSSSHILRVSIISPDYCKSLGVSFSFVEIQLELSHPLFISPAAGISKS